MMVAKKMPIPEPHHLLRRRPRKANKALADAEPRRLIEKAEARGDPLRREVDARIGDDLNDDPYQCDDEQDLERESVPARTPAERSLQPEDKLRRRCSRFNGHRRSGGLGISGSAA